MSASRTAWKEQSDGYLDRTPMLQFVLVSILFAMWAISSSLNDILITQFKAVFQLSDLATAFVQSAFYGGYFVIAIPASLFIKKSSYKMGIVAGLALFAVGCFLFFPASTLATYSMFLFAIFVEAIGLSFLETSSETFTTLMGPKRLATVRLNISQTMNAVGLIVGILLGKYFVFQNSNLKTEMEKMSPEQARLHGVEQLSRTLVPYRYLLIVLVVLILAFAVTRFPSGRARTATGSVKSASLGETLGYLVRNRRYLKGIGAQFVYIGAQTGIWSFTMRLALTMFPHYTDRDASDFMLWSYAVFFVGRFLGSYLLSRFRETRVLTVYMGLAVVVLIGTIALHSVAAVWMAVIVSLFLGPGWPTIYSRTLETVGDRRYTETAGAVIVMSIVGGAVLPALQGALSDAMGMQFSFILPAIELCIVAVYFVSEMRYDRLTPKQMKGLSTTEGAESAQA
ncbi:L-fucose:H+ symporter permease [Bifidobacterium mongoliense]|uniref:L-fucose:H+ symporter permease n=1 Tax=Bifidobacterium mongoliense TaxID=518643 RepID=UPI002649B710|nr:L-fucose:H+ symporter permease [Bifidobacterium mongoliense]MDN6484641.1 L-fucose:H+ symporter permease [Bifidobacterium mongoliense]MDN6783309.1 L-fucose:H+ symporter permease [Bifidobacterium mongoliense]MDN6802925.1 L-fucose:H+ symporter permease [Bifidobacterium mongoliense]